MGPRLLCATRHGPRCWCRSPEPGGPSAELSQGLQARKTKKTLTSQPQKTSPEVFVNSTADPGKLATECIDVFGSASI